MMIVRPVRAMTIVVATVRGATMTIAGTARAGVATTKDAAVAVTRVAAAGSGIPAVIPKPPGAAGKIAANPGLQL